jgi:hypothetical protein
MGGERLKLRMDLQIVPIGLRDGCLEIVDHQPTRNATEIMKRVFKTLNKRFGRLPVNRLAVALPAVAQDHAKNPRPTPLAFAVDDWNSGAEVNLSLVARLDLHASKRYRLLRLRSLATNRRTL